MVFVTIALDQYDDSNRCFRLFIAYYLYYRIIERGEAKADVVRELS